jgi:gliding motility-associated-like protein
MRNKYFFFISFLIFFGLNSTGIAQIEICNNGIDDDNNGLIDCYDTACTSSNLCTGSFIKSYILDTACGFNPPFSDAFFLKQLWASDVTVDTRNTTIVGDIDGDGLPEVFSHNSGVNQLYILDGLTGIAKDTIICPIISEFNDGVAIGDIDKDGYGEIFIITADGILRSFDHNGNVLWVSSVTMGGNYQGSHNRPNLANFNGDDTVEVYVRNKIFNASTGRLIAQGSGSLGGNNTTAHPVAADVLPVDSCYDCSGLELVCGNEVYGIDFLTGTLNLRSSAPAILKDGYTSVADFNSDHLLDVIVVSDNFQVYAWDPRTKLQIGITFTISGNGNGGRANIGNYDNDPELEIGVAGKNKYILIDDYTTGMVQKWEHNIKDITSNVTGSTAFDFDCDSKFEIVYRDEDSLFIFDGSTGTVLSKAFCGSRTQTEVPVIVDVDGDGQANIVCGCASIPAYFTGKVIAWKSSSNNWPPTRKVFNQQTYFTTNINDDLTIPTNQQNNSAAGLPDKLNSFLNQMPLIDQFGNSQCYVNLSDVTIAIDSIAGQACDDSLMIYITVCNISQTTILPIPISFYSGNPLVTGQGALMQTVYTAQPIPANNCRSLLYKIKGMAELSEIYVYVNDLATDILNSPTLKYLECDSTNNSDNDIVFNPLVSSISPSISVCVGASSTFSVSAIGFSPISYLWNNGSVSRYIIPTFNTSQSYSVIVTAGNCSDTLSVSGYTLPITAAFTANPWHGDFPLTVNLINQSINGVNYTWNFDDSADTSTSSLKDPSHIFNNEDNYTVTLIATNNIGCKDTSFYIIRVTGSSVVYIPNAFTPNGDGLNDIFSVIHNNIKEINIRIFDRWGQEVYSNNKLTGGWDGSYNGEKLQEDVYIVLVNYLTIDSNQKTVASKLTLIK